MDTTPDTNESLRTRLCPSHRTLAIALFAVVVIGLSGVAVAQSDILYDDFEDGNADGWTAVDTATVTTDTDSFIGTHSMFVEGGLVRWDDAGDNFTNTEDHYVRGILKTPDTSSFPGANTVGVDFRNDNDDGYRFVLRDDTWTVFELDGGTGIIKGEFDDHGLQNDTWYRYNFTVESSQYKFKLWEAGTAEPTGWDITNTTSVTVNNASLYANSRPGANYDEIGVNTQRPEEIRGTVTEEESGDAIENVDINVTQSGIEVVNTTTNQNGEYSVFVEDGTYNVTASKPGYQTKSETVTVAGSTETVDFELINFDDQIELRTRNFLEHNERVDYEVIIEITNASGTFRSDVRNETIVTSSNTSVVTVDGVEQVIQATSDRSVNNQATLLANYTAPDGTQYNTTAQVTVANATTDNLEILPVMTKLEAALRGNSSGTGEKTIMVVLIATGVGVVAARLATSFAGLGAQTGIVTMGWVMGLITDGVMIVAVFAAMFIGLNVAANINYPTGGLR